MIFNVSQKIFDVAVITDDTCSSLIRIDDVNMDSFRESGMELIETEPYGLRIGDYRESENWYRDIDGVKTQLPLPTPEDESADMLEALETLGYTEVE